MLKIRRPLGRLIFNMGIAIPGKTVFLIETAPRTNMEIFPDQFRKLHSGVYYEHIVEDHLSWKTIQLRADLRIAPSQWQMLLQCNAVSHWLGANLESALQLCGSFIM